MKRIAPVLLMIVSVLTVWAQPPAPPTLVGRFLTDSIDIGRPFQYSLTYRHAATADLLFPDTTGQFSPYRVEKVAVFTTRTSGTGPGAISVDSAVYTLVSFEIDSIQLLRVPVRLINAADCTDLFTDIDTVFLRSQLHPVTADPMAPLSYTLATETTLAPLQQQFNYPQFGLFVAGLLLLSGLLYGVFGRIIRRQWRLYQLNRRHSRFLREFNGLTQGISADTAAETANQAVISWKTYLEKIERRAYSSLTTSEIAERVSDERVTNALREADLMIYGGAFSEQSVTALRVLSDVATQRYLYQRADLQVSAGRPADTDNQPDTAESPVSP
ncbi:hypothetical protein [Spirosoma utsteinense]|uniref:Protein BatD n=1 Tax=Spirosoma utsteinense TaxID=2585773 RepID=A0ABR6WAP6_9BACT|nr:hypothetical protein [Spirosoma utsteinense]MBC3783844.1 hypothetical protein [Spirosoma utsteinense]MBC3793577.1 hypothetical protein [Spirosoma utsteinense]